MTSWTQTMFRLSRFQPPRYPTSVSDAHIADSAFHWSFLLAPSFLFLPFAVSVNLSWRWIINSNLRLRPSQQVAENEMEKSWSTSEEKNTHRTKTITKCVVIVIFFILFRVKTVFLRGRKHPSSTFDVSVISFMFLHTNKSICISQKLPRRLPAAVGIREAVHRLHLAEWETARLFLFFHTGVFPASKWGFRVSIVSEGVDHIVQLIIDICD